MNVIIAHPTLNVHLYFVSRLRTHFQLIHIFVVQEKTTTTTTRNQNIKMHIIEVLILLLSKYLITTL